MLEGVVGRRAGTVPGYPYSAALARADVVWSADSLDKWLANPQGFIAGAQMPFHLPDPLRRRDVIAYLATLKQPSAAHAAHAAQRAASHPG
jgi:cytochrome c2